MSEETYASAFQAPEVEEVARLFPAYQISHLIACGGMGAVYYAIQLSLNRPVAIKILPLEFSSDAEFRESFESEAKAMAKLNDPNLIGVFDFGEAGGMLFIVMEYVAGQSLYQAAKQSAIDQADALPILINICYGLAHAHKYGIMHRDIKPANILLDAENNPKIGDFGLARAMGRSVQAGEQIFGTPGYTAPEVLTPPYSFDQRADIFSVGAMIYELITGKLPNSDPRTASSLSGCDRRIDKVIKKSTNNNPAQRYDSATELAADLQEIVSSLKYDGNSISRDHTQTSSRALASIGKPTMQKAQSSGSGGLYLIVALLVGGVIAYLVIQNKQEILSSSVPSPTIAEQAVATPTTEEQVAKIDPKAALIAVRSSIRSRCAPFHEKYHVDLKANLFEYQKALTTAAASVPADEQERVKKSISTAFQVWQDQNFEMTPSAPAGFSAIANSSEIHESYLQKQSSIEKRFNEEVSRMAGVYLLELENELGNLKKSGKDVSIPPIEQEIEAINMDRSRLLTLVGIEK